MLKKEKFLDLLITVKFEEEPFICKFEDVLDQILIDQIDFENFLVVQREVSFEVINRNILRGFNYISSDFLDILSFQKDLLNELWKEEVYNKKNHGFTF